MWKAGAALILMAGSPVIAGQAPLDSATIGLQGEWQDSCPQALKGIVELSAEQPQGSYLAAELFQPWSPTNCVASGTNFTCQKFQHYGTIVNDSVIVFSQGCRWTRILPPTPPPTPKPCTVCSGVNCCNPNTPTPQLCPDLSPCCDCGAKFCQCP